LPEPLGYQDVHREKASLSVWRNPALPFHSNFTPPCHAMPSLAIINQDAKHSINFPNHHASAEVGDDIRDRRRKQSLKTRIGEEIVLSRNSKSNRIFFVGFSPVKSKYGWFVI
jgi:hypothetical protein